MKKFLFLALLLIAIASFGQEAKEIIGKPIKIGNLLVAENDFPDTMEWSDAKTACSELGKGWRLPTIEELRLLYLNQKKVKNFTSNNYWSSTKDNRGWYYLDFANSKKGYLSINNEFSSDIGSPNVRAVKSF
jgi:hypothetical protein